MDRSISIWDTRESSSSVISLTLPTTSPVPSVSCHPTSPFTLASATYSGLLQIWDVRSPKTALFSVEKRSGFTGEKAVKEDELVGGKGKKGRRVVQGERILGLDWDGEVLCAGGEDGEVGVWRARGE
jgi:ribosome biogenesis protein YTM1